MLIRGWWPLCCLPTLGPESIRISPFVKTQLYNISQPLSPGTTSPESLLSNSNAPDNFRSIWHSFNPYLRIPFQTTLFFLCHDLASKLFDLCLKNLLLGHLPLALCWIGAWHFEYTQFLLSWHVRQADSVWGRVRSLSRSILLAGMHHRSHVFVNPKIARHTSTMQCLFGKIECHFSLFSSSISHTKEHPLLSFWLLGAVHILRQPYF